MGTGAVITAPPSNTDAAVSENGEHLDLRPGDALLSVNGTRVDELPITVRCLALSPSCGSRTAQKCMTCVCGSVCVCVCVCVCVLVDIPQTIGHLIDRAAASTDGGSSAVLTFRRAGATSPRASHNPPASSDAANTGRVQPLSAVQLLTTVASPAGSLNAQYVCGRPCVAGGVWMPA